MQAEPQAEQLLQLQAPASSGFFSSSFLLRALGFVAFSVGCQAASMVLGSIWNAVRGGAGGGPSAPAAAAAPPEGWMPAAPPAPEPMSAEEEAILREIIEGYFLKAEGARKEMGDKRLTVEHLLVALSQDPRFRARRAAAPPARGPSRGALLCRPGRAAPRPPRGCRAAAARLPSQPSAPSEH